METPRKSGVNWGCYSTPTPPGPVPSPKSNVSDGQGCTLDGKQDRRALPYNPLLPPRAQEAGTEELSLPPELRLFQGELRQVFASPVLPFAGSEKLIRRAGSAAPD